MRISRGRISVGAPTPEILVAQQAAQKVATTHSSPVQMTEPESVDSLSAAETGTETEGEPETETETDTEVRRQSDGNGAPPRPSFREPPPELDDMPPRPTFREPPPELDDGLYTSTRPPTFVSPPGSPPPEPAFSAAAVGAEGRTTPSSSHSPPLAVTPATPQNPIKALRRNSAVRSSGSASPARSPSPATMSGRSGGGSATAVTEDQPLNPGRAGLSRHTSGQAALRGPRLARGPRTQGGTGSVSSMVANLNNRMSTTSPPPSPGRKRLSGGSRPTSTFGGSSVQGRGGRGGLSRRTMASDAEDEVVDK